MAESLKNELEELRSQMAALSKQVADTAASAAKTAKATSRAENADALSKLKNAASKGLSQAESIAEDVHFDELSQKLSDYLQGLGQDVKDSKPQALVASFLCGLAVGKLLGR